MLEVQNISFSYSDKITLDDLSFSVKPGEHISVIGASGCGKSTLLQAIYGLHHVEGTIHWNGKQLLGPNFNLVPGEDFIKYLAQDFDLMPPLSVADNIGKYLSNMYPVRKKRRVRELLELVEMQELANVKARNLSGGQQQRVALARVLANEPELLLLDEPFSHIDHFRKNNLRRRLFAHLKKEKITCLVATHDSTDALSFADRTFVMNESRIIAMDTPQTLYEQPPNAYVASLFGEVNILPRRWFDLNSPLEKKVILYPHELEISGSKGIEAIVERAYYKGHTYLVEVNCENEQVFVENAEPVSGGKSVYLSLRTAKTLALRR